MNKKFLVPALCSIVLAAGISTVMAKDTNATALPAKAEKQECCQKFDKHPPRHEMSKEDWEKMKQKREEKRQEFEDRLNLTAEQKELAKQNHEKGKEEMKPLMEQMKPKYEKMHSIRESNLSDEEKAKQIDAIKAELKPLKAKANEIREKNMKAFEAILTPAQKTELEKMKAEHKGKHGKFDGPPHRRHGEMGKPPGPRPECDCKKPLSQVPDKKTK